jgi:hypothetical protein
MNLKHAACTFALFAGLPGALAQPVIFSSAGSDSDVINTVNAFRAAIGALNPNVPGSFISGRREINWDAVPDSASAPNLFPGSFLNANVAPRARGAEFFTPGSGFMLSADDDNPTSTPKDYANIDPSYLATFREFSPQRLFTPLDSVITDVKFFIPGQSRTRATVKAFGVVFSDVDLPGPTRIICIDASGATIANVAAPVSGAGQEGFSFLGIAFTGGEQIWRVQIITGTHVLGPGVVDNPGAGVDLVVMDDFLYDEPVAATNPEIFASGGTDQEVADAVAAYRAALGASNAGNPGSFGSGRRDITWDGANDAVASPNPMPANLFNGPASPLARGIVFSTPGSHFEQSADSSNATSTPVEFANLDPSYLALFRPFSSPRLFTPVGSNITDADFFVAGSDTPAFVAGFGAVFCDVDLRTSSRIDWLDQSGGLLASIHVPPGSAAEESFSFLAARFPAPYRVASVRITSGTAGPGAGVLENVGAGADIVVMDDFIYGEPVELPPFCAADVNGSGAVNSQDFFDFITSFFASDADFNLDGITNSQDFYDFLIAFFAGC